MAECQGWPGHILPAVGILAPPPFRAHALLDSGDGEKLERYGPWVLRRPDPQALWRPRLPAAEWRRRADLVFVRESDRGGRWEAPQAGRRPPVAEGWEVELDDLPGLPPVRVRILPSPFKHLGLFPEQAANWVWLEARRRELAAAGVERPRLLNLFAYTGAASLLAARAGWQVTHVDASRTSLDQAAANARASGLPADAIRWLLDDALALARREVRRGRRYHGILLDPPHYGRGPKGEKWLLETGLAPLLEACAALLEPTGPACLALSAYATGISSLTLENLLLGLGPGRREAGDLALREEGDGGRWLPCGFCARWWRKA